MLLNTIVSDSYLKEFRKRCRQNESRTSISYFGLDFIIDRLGSIHLIEINGQNSGTNGFKEAYGHDFAKSRVMEYLSSFGLPVKVYGDGNRDMDVWKKANDIESTDTRSFLLEAFKAAIGDDSLTENDDLISILYKRRDEIDLVQVMKDYRARIEMGINGSEGESSGNGIYGLKSAEGIIWVNNYNGLPVDENRFLAVNSKRIDDYLDCKLNLSWFTDYLVVDGCYFMEFSNDYFENNNYLARCLDYIKSDKVVFKPDMGSCGNGVIVMDRKMLVDSHNRLQKTLPDLIENPENHFDNKTMVDNISLLKKRKRVIMQPFIESKPFHYANTGKDHRGVIRYIVVAHSDLGKIEIEPIGGYVRLAPEPISDSAESCVINYSKGAHASPLLRRDSSRLEGWVKSQMPSIYRRLLRLGINRNDDPVKGYVCPSNYLYIENEKRYYKELWRDNF